MVTNPNYLRVCECVCAAGCVSVWEPSPYRLGDDVSGAFQWVSKGGKDRVEGLLLPHTWLDDGWSAVPQAPSFLFDVPVSG